MKTRSGHNRVQPVERALRAFTRFLELARAQPSLGKILRCEFPKHFFARQPETAVLGRARGYSA